MEVVFVGKPLPFVCCVKDCQFSQNPILADRPQIRTHLIQKHDYKQLQGACFQQKLIPSLMFRSHAFFISMLWDYGIVKGNSF